MNCNNTPIELAVLSDAFAIAIAKDNTAEDNNIIGNFLVAVGSIILTIAAQQAAQDGNKQ
jgi:hypothetical protein